MKCVLNFSTEIQTDNHDNIWLGLLLRGDVFFAWDWSEAQIQVDFATSAVHFGENLSYKNWTVANLMNNILS